IIVVPDGATGRVVGRVRVDVRATSSREYGPAFTEGVHPVRCGRVRGGLRGVDASSARRIVSNVVELVRDLVGERRRAHRWIDCHEYARTAVCAENERVEARFD